MPVSVRSAKHGGECPKKLSGGGDSKRCPLGDRLGEVPGVMRQQPVGFASHGRQKDEDVGFVANQVTTGPDLVLAWVGNNLRMSQLNEVTIVVNHLVGCFRWQALGVDEQILLYFIADNFRRYQLAHSCGAEREDRLVESPGRDNSASQDIRIQEQADSARGCHFWLCGRRRGTEPRTAFFR